MKSLSPITSFRTKQRLLDKLLGFVHARLDANYLTKNAGRLKKVPRQKSQQALYRIQGVYVKINPLLSVGTLNTDDCGFSRPSSGRRGKNRAVGLLKESVLDGPISGHLRLPVFRNGYEELLRARRRRHRWREREGKLYDRHRFLAKDRHAEGKTRHGMRRAARRGLVSVAIQVYRYRW